MFNKKLIASVIMAGTIAITGTAAAFAIKSDDTGCMGEQQAKPATSPGQNTPNTFIPARINHENMHVLIKSALDNLVKDRTITQAQEDAVLKAMAARKEKGYEKGKGYVSDVHRKSPINELVKTGTITQAQADAIKDAFKSARGSGKTKKEVLDSLIKAGTITQAQMDAIKKAAPHKDGKCAPNGRKHGMLGELVKAGTITREQAEAIREAIKSAHDSVYKPEGRS